MMVLSCGKWAMKRRAGLHVEHAVQALGETAVGAELVPRDLPMRVMMPHAEHDVDRIGQLHAHLGQRRAGQAHEVRHDVHGAALHGAAAQAVELLVHLGGLHPVIGRAGGLGRAGADEGKVLDARDVVGIGAVQVAAGEFFLVELDEHAHVDGLLREAFLFLFAAVAPDDLVGPAELRHLVDPGVKAGVRGGARLGGWGRDGGHGKLWRWGFRRARLGSSRRARVERKGDGSMICMRTIIAKTKEGR